LGSVLPVRAQRAAGANLEVCVMAGHRGDEPEQGRILDQPISRRRLLKNVAAMSVAEAVLPLAAACRPAAPAATVAPPQPSRG
jgi:hypothetical protein